MQFVSQPDALRRALAQLRTPPGAPQPESVGFVPTMGALHAGHLALVELAQGQNARSVVSIFVNPTQFGPGEDLENYPRTLEADLEALEARQVDLVFAPTPQDLYPSPNRIQLHDPELYSRLEGAARPRHFSGVALVVAKLFNLVQPTRAYFGQKDYQQTVVIRQLIQELCFPVELVVGPTVRENDGLALSSRNRYLSPAARSLAPKLYAMLQHLQQQAHPGMDARELAQTGQALLAQTPDFQLDYLAIADGRTLEPLTTLEPQAHPIALVAAYLQGVRLLDNIHLLGHGL